MRSQSRCAPGRTCARNGRRLLIVSASCPIAHHAAHPPIDLASLAVAATVRSRSRPPPRNPESRRDRPERVHPQHVVRSFITNIKRPVLRGADTLPQGAQHDVTVAQLERIVAMTPAALRPNRSMPTTRIASPGRAGQTTWPASGKHVTLGRCRLAGTRAPRMVPPFGGWFPRWNGIFSCAASLLELSWVPGTPCRRVRPIRLR